MITHTLSEIGLDKKEAEIYLKLLRSGPQRASVLAYHMNFPRSTVQNILLRLENMNVVTKILDKNVYIYQSVHPDHFEHIVEMKKRHTNSKYDRLIDDLKKVNPQLVSMMGSDRRLPNVQFFQGKKAVRKVLFDSLTSKTELKDFANVDAMFEHVQDINNEYVAARERTNITKRSLLLDTPFARKVYEAGSYSSKSHRGYKWIDKELYPFTIEMNIYDGKVSYLTYVEDDFVGVIIENEYIYKMHDSMWNLVWDMLPMP